MLIGKRMSLAASGSFNQTQVYYIYERIFYL
jgi:hypothetical protein